MRLPKLEHLLAFQAVAEHLSFTRAAVQLNQSQSAISHQIRKLEAELGVQLFTRSAHSVQVTTAGVLLRAKITQPLAELELACQTVGQRDESSRLSIELEPAFASQWLTPRLGDFGRRFPKVQLNMHFSTQRFEFPREVELAIKWGIGPWPGCEAKRLMGLRMTPMCAPSYAKKHNLQTPKQIAKLRLLHDRSPQFWLHWLEEASLPTSGFTQGFIFDDMNVLTSSAVNGLGLMLGILDFSEETLGNGTLVVPFPEIVISPPQAYHLLWRKEGRLTANAREFQRWIFSEVAKIGK